jgi:uncharacterized protein (UPF0218 family)
MLTLPKEHRKLFQEPFGELHRNIEEIIPRITGRTVYAVGDVVTHNLHKSGISPAIAVVDGYTMRSPCSRMPVVLGECMNIKNAAGTLTDDLIRALDYAVAHPPVTIMVDGEEDLAVIPLVLAAPEGSIVLYGQPHRGVVLRTVDRSAKEIARHLLSHFIRAEP